MTYPGAETPAVDGLDLQVAEGEVYGLLGPNGAGKTTTISILSTLLHPCGGEVLLGGVDALRQARQVRRSIGLVPQEIALYPTLTLRENFAYFGRIYGLRGGMLKERIADCALLVGLQDSLDRRVETCSGGMKRRANLAAGILHSPKVLFLDEPTVGIDAQSRSMILDNLCRLRDGGMTMIYTTHYMEEARQLCSRVGIMDRGRILREGVPGELVAAEGVSDLEELFLRLTGRALRDG